MKHKLISFLATGTLLLTVLWMVFITMEVVVGGTQSTLVEKLAYIAQFNVLFFLTHLSAALITLTTALLFAALYRYIQNLAPEIATMGLILIPAYVVCSFIVSFTQITVVPTLNDLYRQPEYQSTAYVLLQQILQTWPTSSAALVNGLAYSLLGISSIFFGWILMVEKRLSRWAGALLALDGLAYLIGFAGIVARNNILRIGYPLGWILFLAALIFLSRPLFEVNRAS